MGDLLKAIYTIGHTKSVCYWFQSYFTNRLLLVNFGEFFSQAVNESSGAPQVFILGPLLIFIYFNEYQKLSNVIYSFMLMIRIWLVKRILSMKSKSNTKSRFRKYS